MVYKLDYLILYSNYLNGLCIFQNFLFFMTFWNWITKAIEDREREHLPFVKKIKQQKRNYAIPMQEFATVPIISKN